ncbi:MAG: pantetheine-phosphate adenylyltransferase [Deltaproteobacteria bacterium]|nr:pantetheine-phosphate adenylyltransferase [Deltaproteobacteria bacterium]
MEQRLAIYPGSFDPVTNGHVDILTRACGLFDRVIVAVAENIGKNALFSSDERVALLKEVFEDDEGVEVCAFTGLLIDYARERGARAIVRGLRAVADFEYEFQLALMNRSLAGELDTIFLMTAQKNFYVSSSLVKEVARFGGDVSGFVPRSVGQAMAAKLSQAEG